MDKSIKNKPKPVKVKEPLLRLSRRADFKWYQALLIRAGAILAALVVCAVLIFAITKMNPLDVYGTMFKGIFGEKLFDQKIGPLDTEPHRLDNRAGCHDPAVHQRGLSPRL